MSRARLYSVIAFGALALSALACSILKGNGSEIPGPSPVFVTPTAVGAAQPAPGDAAQPTQADAQPPNGGPQVPPQGGFTSGDPVDPATLPNLFIAPAGMGPILCEDTPPGPAISASPLVNDQTKLCLYHFPEAAGSPDITVSLTAPDGTNYTETFAYVDTGGSVRVEGTRGGYGSFPPPDFAPPGAPPSITIALNTPANVPVGQWTASASNADGSVNVPPTPVTVEHFQPLVSAVPGPDADPFVHPLTPYASGQTIYVYGIGYTPGPITVAFYWQDPAAPPSDLGTPTLVARYATALAVDGAGSFQTEFVVGSETPVGSYNVVAAPTITADRPPDPFTSGFSIE